VTGWIPDVVPDAVVASSWGNKIRDRTVTPFATIAERTAALPLPKVGMVTWIDDTDRLDFWNGVLWKALPRGDLGYAQIVANTGNFIGSPGGLIAGLALTLGAQPANRLLLVDVQGMLLQNTAATTATLAIKVNGAQIVQGNYYLNPGTGISPHLQARYVTVAGAVTVEVWGWTQAGATILQCGGPYPSFVQVTDIGAIP